MRPRPTSTSGAVSRRAPKSSSDIPRAGAARANETTHTPHQTLAQQRARARASRAQPFLQSRSVHLSRRSVAAVLSTVASLRRAAQCYALSRGNIVLCCVILVSFFAPSRATRAGAIQPRSCLRTTRCCSERYPRTRYAPGAPSASPSPHQCATPFAIAENDCDLATICERARKGMPKSRLDGEAMLPRPMSAMSVSSHFAAYVNRYFVRDGLFFCEATGLLRKIAGRSSSSSRASSSGRTNSVSTRNSKSAAWHFSHAFRYDFWRALLLSIRQAGERERERERKNASQVTTGRHARSRRGNGR